METLQQVSARTSIDVCIENLSPGGQLLIWSMREWARAARRKECVCPELGHAYSVAGCPEAVAVLNEYMSLIAIAARRPIDIRCPHQKILSEDECLLLDIIKCLQAGQEQESLHMIHQIINGCLGMSFCRAASIYAQSLKDSKLPLNKVTRLHIIK